MKKTVKKLVAVGLTLTTVMSLVACGSAKDEEGSTGANDQPSTQKEVTKPGKFTVMVDNTVVAETNGGEAFYDYLMQLTGLEIEFIRPDHSTYYEGVARAFNDEATTPDVVLLSADYYALYAANDMLWNMTEAWANSETKNSGRLISTADNIFKSLEVLGPDGKMGMYGFSPYRGNGCCTFVKVDWLTKAGYKVEDVKGKTMTFDEYYTMLEKMHTATGKTVISPPGYIINEPPWTFYLPEFYQKAEYTFYKNSAGNYVDGFSEKAMQDGLARIAKGVADGIIDKEAVGATTSVARQKFDADNAGVFTYWAGTWAKTLKTNLEGKGLSGELIALNPIKELGTYLERLAPCWCITTQAENPEGIFKYFIDTMLDGADVQTAWEYGAKGTHWDDKAETVQLQGKPETARTFTAGQFHMLPSTDKPAEAWMQKNHIDPIIALATFVSGKDPGDAAIDPIAKENGQWFATVSTVAQPLPMTEELGDNLEDIKNARNEVIANICNGSQTVAEGMKYYQDKVGRRVEEVLDSLNAIGKDK